MLTVNEIREKITKREFLFSQHAIEESSKDMIQDEDIYHSILKGEIIENYPNDPRGESCLLNGQMPDGRFLHTVIGKWDDKLILITAIFPVFQSGLPQLSEDKRRKRMDRCYFCKSDDLAEETIDYSFSWGNNLILFREVPALVCSDCGEKYFRPEISTNMKQMAKEIKEGKREFRELTVPTVKFEETVI